MISFFANIFGYLLNIIYELIKNYGLAIILFSILLKLILLPLTIKQQKSMKKSQKVQGKVKEIQDKYKNNPEKMNQEIMDLYKRENLSPFSGCLSSIIQIVLLFGMFYLVRSPLTYMKKMDKDTITKFKDQIVLEQGENSVSATYPEISIIKYINNKINNKEETVGQEETNQNSESEEQVEKLDIKEDLYINMNFLGLDLSSIPGENYGDLKVFIIPILYIISSLVSIKLTQAQTEKMMQKDNKKEESNEEEPDMTAQMNKYMVWMMPILAVSVSLVAPLGLALYWLVNNILMIGERIVIDKFVMSKEEEENDK